MSYIRDMLRWVWGELAAFGQGQYSRDIRTLLFAILTLLALWFAFQIGSYFLDRVALIILLRGLLPGP